jgi:hypothetical protein
LTSPGITSGFNDIAGANTTTGVITFDQTGTFMLQFASYDNGNTINITDLSRNFATLRDPDLYWNDSIASTLLVGYGFNQTMFQTALALEGGEDAVSAFGSYNSVAVGNLSIATINYPVTDTGQMAGYSVSAARGNLAASSTLTVTNSNDFLGYFNAITYTGTGVNQPQTLEQVSSIGFYATGANNQTGLGGNVAFFTHVPGTTANVVTQAVGIENDQSARFYGNVVLGQLGTYTTPNSAYVPIHSTSSGNIGQVAWSTAGSGSYFYLCVGQNSWQRVALSSTSW